MKSVKYSCLLAAVYIVAAVGFAHAGTLDKVFRSVENARWGSGQGHFVRSFGRKNITFATKRILSVPAELGKYKGSMNYLFDKKGRLYNLAWYATIPVAAMRDVQELEKQMEAELRAKYGDPVREFSDGDASKAVGVAAKGGVTSKDMAELFLTPGGAGVPKNAEGKVDLDKMMMMMPVIFYSKLTFWDAGEVWAYTNLLCSTDGTCYLHLQFVSKKLTDGEQYRPASDIPFSYSPLDRDQDIVTDTHKAWNNRQTKRKS